VQRFWVRATGWLSAHGERWAMLQFALSALVTVVLVLVLALVAFDRAGRAEAIAIAEEVTQIAATGVIAPMVDDDVLARRPAALAQLDDRVRASLLREPVLRVTVYRSDGRVVYSSNPRLAARVRLQAGMREALRTGRPQTRTGVPRDPDSDLAESVQLLDVYQPITAPSGERLLVEYCRRLTSVWKDSRELFDQFAPYMVGGVLAVQLLNLPLVVALVRRLRRGRRHEELLLQREIAASERERRRLATDLHNGVIQDLAGMSMALTASQHSATARGDTDAAAQLQAVAASSRRTTRMLRHVLVDIYPPNLERTGLRNALGDLLETVRRRDVAVDVSLDDELDALSPVIAAVLYRVVQEAVRNVVAHANASRMDLRVEGSASGDVRVCVADDGRGFVPSRAPLGNVDGHVGLALIHDLVDQAGGDLVIISAPGAGTEVRARIPAP
jgi:two-component system NarL family sensor kinase